MIEAWGALLDWLRAVLPAEVLELMWASKTIYLTPWFWLLAGAILLVERLRPAVPTQRVFSWGLLQDFVWFNLDLVFKVMALPVVAGLTLVVYDLLTGGYRVQLMMQWPLWLRIGVAVLAFDCLMWLLHWLRHKITVIWHFHAVHHSQREINLFTDLRVHAVEYVFNDIVSFVPMFALGLPALVVMGMGSARIWYTRFIHANIRTNLGPLKHVLVTPQYHRVHHSLDPRHHEKNFATLFTLWDRLFGTLCRDYDVYPPTGVEDIAFEVPRTFRPTAWARDYWRLFSYPFRRVLRGASTEGRDEGV